jgi:hypothetical protein
MMIGSSHPSLALIVSYHILSPLIGATKLSGINLIKTKNNSTVMKNVKNISPILLSRYFSITKSP